MSRTDDANVYGLSSVAFLYSANVVAGSRRRDGGRWRGRGPRPTGRCGGVEAPALQRGWGAELAVGFVGGDGGGVGEVDAAGVGAGHGDAEEAVGVAVVELWGEAAAFVAEDEGVAGAEVAGVEGAFAACAEEEEAGRGGVFEEEIGRAKV